MNWHTARAAAASKCRPRGELDRRNFTTESARVRRRLRRLFGLIPRDRGRSCSVTVSEDLGTIDLPSAVAASHLFASFVSTYKAAKTGLIEAGNKVSSRRSKGNHGSRNAIALNWFSHRDHRGRMASFSVNSVTSVANLLVAASGRAGSSVFDPIVVVTPSLALRASGLSKRRSGRSAAGSPGAIRGSIRGSRGGSRRRRTWTGEGPKVPKNEAIEARIKHSRGRRLRTFAPEYTPVYREFTPSTGRGTAIRAG